MDTRTVGTDPTEAESEGNCRDCGQRILWAESENGKWTPLDPMPVAPGDGGVFALEDGTAYHVPAEYRDRGEFFRFHGIACPGSDG